MELHETNVREKGEVKGARIKGARMGTEKKKRDCGLLWGMASLDQQGGKNDAKFPLREGGGIVCLCTVRTPRYKDVGAPRNLTLSSLSYLCSGHVAGRKVKEKKCVCLG